MATLVVAAVIPAAVQAQVTAAPGVARSSIDPSALAISPTAMRAFETGLAGAPRSGDRSGTIASLHWTALAGARGYRVLRGHSLNERFVDVTPRGMDAGATAADVGGLIPQTTFFFRVAAVDASGRVVDSTSSVVVTTPAMMLADPDVIACRAVSPSTIQLVWHAVPEATGYKVNLKLAPQTPLGSAVTSDTTYTRAGLPAGDVEVTLNSAFRIRDWPTMGDSTVVSPVGHSPGQTTISAFRATFPVTSSQPVSCHR